MTRRPGRPPLVSLWRRITRGIATLVRRGEADRDVADEVAHYLEEAEAELVSRGATPGEARRSVRLSYGDGLAAREDVRRYGWENAADEALADVRLAARRLRRSPGFTTVAVLTLGLGIGAATAIFSAVRPVLFDPLAYPEAERILSIADRSQDGSIIPVTFGTYREIRERVDAFEHLAVFKPWQPTLTGGDEPQRLEGQSVSADYFRALGVAPAFGPGFDAADDRPGGPHLVILGHGLWQRAFGADPAVIGRTIRLDGDAYSVVGVMPPGFENATAGGAQAWSLLQYSPLEASFDSREWGHHLGMIGRVAPGVDLEAARRALDRVAAAPLPRFERPAWASLQGGLLARHLREASTADARPTMVVLFGAVGLLLIVACVNVTMLLLGRGARRRGELAMREALGAGRGRLVRHLLTESLLLAGLGGVVGVAVARVGLAGLVAASPPSLAGVASAGIDGAALGAAFVLTTLVGLLFGLAPALAAEGNLPEATRETSRGSMGSRSARHVLVVVEVALAMVLLVGAGLLLRSTQRLFSQPTGFDASGLVVMQVQGTGLEHGDAATHRFFDGALEAVRSVPGVSSAVMTNQLPLSGAVDVYGVTLADGREGESVDGAAYRYAVAPGYFETMGIPSLRGRQLERGDDADAPPVAVVSESLARRMFPAGEAVGGRIYIGAQEDPPYTIVGVVADVKQASLDANDGDAVYVPSHQWHWADRVRWIAVRADRGAAAGLVPALRRAVWSVDRNQPITGAQSMDELVARSESQRRFVLLVLMAFALAALGLAGIGLYGVLSGTVTERMRELGVRAALGASRGNILGLVLRQGMVLTGLGAGIGVVVAAAASEVLVTLLFGVTRLDVVTYVSVAGALGLVAALACWLPAARAAGVDPLTTLRAE